MFDSSPGRGGTPLDQPLSPRELDIVERITNGMTNDEIAKDLYLSINSVKTYVRTAYRKIGVESRTHAILWGVKHGLLAGEERHGGGPVES